MNRKLSHISLALSATGMALLLLLAAGSPVWQPVQQAEAGIASGAPASELVVDSVSQRRHLRHSRALLALPYFSFAQGLRRNRS
jgi:hypothetical protein